ncbi:ribosome maturation factor RimM [Kordiimonas pumila]|uniref:Ribosome maturation factor RimM n=1 Tax=Kordiimonas pumila TaxID=2161677 RepID=A0ABV7D6Z4_9PROT|nr:ribosome maturation factor RimM [Kordiimonas pumila]
MAATDQTERQQAGVEGDWICVGAFAGSHGVKGDVRLKSFTEDPAAIFSYTEIHKGPTGPLLRFKKLRDSKEGFIVRVEGLLTPEDAQALSGTKLYVSRAAFAEHADDDEFYLADLIGLRAIDEDGIDIGFVRAVENFGAEDLLELVLPEPIKGLGRYIYVPFRKAFVPEVALGAGTVSIAFKEWQKTQVSERDGADEV